jgi:hypothetical protein
MLNSFCSNRYWNRNFRKNKRKYLRLLRKKTVLQPENLVVLLGLTISNQLLGLMNRLTTRKSN